MHKQAGTATSTQRLRMRNRSTRGGEQVVFPHSCIFWPQDPAVTFLFPVPVAGGVDALDVIG